jgi:hypothetical protein
MTATTTMASIRSIAFPPEVILEVERAAKLVKAAPAQAEAAVGAKVDREARAANSGDDDDDSLVVAGKERGAAKEMQEAAAEANHVQGIAMREAT